MNEIMQAAIYAMIGIMVWDLAKMAYRKLTANRKQKADDYAYNKHLDEIAAQGYSAHYYVPSIGLTNNELRNSLDYLASKGFIITDSNEVLVGKVAKARMDSTELAEQRRATFKIIK
ncbi:hypothetical protein [Moritella sp. F3]|uniref:hypothetical protein n=1 Tax=Moritella sp. F3 TaxID=2718882 RepID=UPI0018E0F80F|nr:hypothetical protein [Moritella sp. F3]GIC77141.1 hypothetical protein FMO001_18680 [Moritella sp. F1]GIC82260.1 hypothetical protein FMO003_25410 [Moritella sp. F3]